METAAQALRDPSSNYLLHIDEIIFSPEELQGRTGMLCVSADV